MNYESYYQKQTQKNPVFRSVPSQRGYGLGGIFRWLFKFIVPIFKEHGIPLLKSVGESVLKGSSNFAKDALEGKTLKDSAKRRFEETLDEISDKAKVSKGEGGIGSSKNTPFSKRKNKIINSLFKKKSKKKKKRKLDIFDKLWPAREKKIILQDHS